MYPDLRTALLKRGWKESHAPLTFTLKWTMAKASVNFNSLQPEQLVNHFEHMGVTSKKGLWYSLLNNYRFENGRQWQAMFPRCYDLSDPQDIQAFVTDFKVTHA